MSQIKSVLDSSGKLHIRYIDHLRDTIDDPKSTAGEKDSAQRALQFFAAQPETFEETMKRRMERVRQSRVLPK
jgi:hypothetical protein